MSWLSNLFQKKPSFERAFLKCKTPAEVCAVIRRWIAIEETWSLTQRMPLDTWLWRKGNCQDIAQLVLAGLFRSRAPKPIVQAASSRRYYERKAALGERLKGHALAWGPLHPEHRNQPSERDLSESFPPTVDWCRLCQIWWSDFGDYFEGSEAAMDRYVERKYGMKRLQAKPARKG